MFTQASFGSAVLKSNFLVKNTTRKYQDGYRLALKSKSRKIEANKTEEEKFSNHVEECLLKKKRSLLRHTERIHPKFKPAVSPNDKFLGKTNLPTYGSLKNYAKEAERERKLQQENGVYWQTMDKIWQQEKNKTEFKNIGDEIPKDSIDSKKLQKILFENRKTLEESSRKKTLKLDEIGLTDEWESTAQGIKSIHQIVHHYGIFKDLFNSKHFFPTIPMEIGYQDEEDFINPVFYGNDLSPSDTMAAPHVKYESSNDQMWSLVLVNLDGNLEDSRRQYLHWMVCNIKGNDVSSGELMADYLMPLPMRGTGYHRMVFMLFRQKHYLGLDAMKRESDDLRARSFSTKSFYTRYRKFLTPTSIKFFQTIWDDKVQDKYHDLGMAEPVYQYQVPEKHMHTLRRYPLPGHKRTLLWLSRFMPNEPIFPGGGHDM